MTMNKTQNAGVATDSALDAGSVSKVRPSNGLQMMQAFADGKTCEIPRRMVKMSLEFLESQLGDWSVKVGKGSSKQWATLTPTDDTPLKFRRLMKKQNKVITTKCN